MLSIRIVTSTIVSLFLLGCAAKDTMTREQKLEAYNAFIKTEQLKSIDRIQSFRLQGWTALDEKHMILSKSLNKPYLITFKNNCTDLDFANAIKVVNHGGMLQAKFDYITVPNTIEVRCYIASIYELSKEQKKALIAIGKPVEEKSE